MRVTASATNTVRRLLLICLFAPAVVATADDTPPAAAVAPGPVIAHSSHIFGGVKAILIRAAEQMPEEKYAFRPTEAVRSYGQIIGHVADAQYSFCSAVLGEKNPALKIEKTKSSKADLVAALKDAFAYCDGAYDSITDASASEMVKFMGDETPKFGVLTVNSVHTIEHYGNLVTYLRMNNIVPPTSEPGFLQSLRQK